MNIKSVLVKIIKYRPSKRLIMFIITMTYILSKIYVVQNDNPNDDNLPDLARDAILTIVHTDADDHVDEQEWDKPVLTSK